ncbi:hypothetical protein QOZ80_3BG0260580 [Eleusine coracana subsp. coracana]|nr:hypothetical protein QOZ80_3BG0260580 [Eleusine coracana subsp. coracana]
MGSVTAAPHVMVLPFPAQGHVTPLMELSHRLVERGFEVTFVNTELIHQLMLEALRPANNGGTGCTEMEGIRLVSVPDGLAEGDDRRDLGKYVDSVRRCVPGYLEQLIRDTEASGRAKVKWLVGDVTMAMCFGAASKLGVRVAGFCPASAACYGMVTKVPQLIEDGFMDENGSPKRHDSFELAPGLPKLCPTQMPWSIDGAPEGQQATYQMMSGNIEATIRFAEIVACNSFLDAEPAAFEHFPGIMSIGPLFADSELRKPVGQFLPEDARSLQWLDSQPDRSVVYVAFGSLAMLDRRQFEELALGLELTGRPFLWVVRPDFTTGGLSKAWFDEFQDRVGGKGMVVSWCPQQKVLAHRAVACFVSHCGWNSTMEGVRNGVPFVCWPYFCDQHLDRNYICDIWRTGLEVLHGDDGIVTKEEVSSKVNHVIEDQGIAERARTLKDAARNCLSEKGGSSYENFNKLVDLLRE